MTPPTPFDGADRAFWQRLYREAESMPRPEWRRRRRLEYACESRGCGSIVEVVALDAGIVVATEGRRLLPMAADLHNPETTIVAAPCRCSSRTIPLTMIVADLEQGRRRRTFERQPRDPD